MNNSSKNRPIITFRLCLGRTVAGRDVKTVLTCNIPFINTAARDKGSKEIEAALKVLDKYEIFQKMRYEHATEIVELKEDTVKAITDATEKVSLDPPTPQPSKEAAEIDSPV